jgi:hypothetical protein
MSFRISLTLLGFVMIGFGVVERGWAIMFGWLGVNFVLLGLAHARHGHRLFGKRGDGTLPIWSWLVFLPLHTLNTILWHSIRRFSGEPSQNAITDHLVVGRRLLTNEVEGHFDNYVDLTSEFAEPAPIGESPCYVLFPLLDGSAPSPETLHVAVTSLRPGRTFVHCAQGHGRTGLFALAVLIESGEASSIEDGLHLLLTARPGIRLNREQRQCIEQYVRAYPARLAR